MALGDGARDVPTATLKVLGMTVWMGAVGCTVSGTFGPVDTDDVLVSLAVSGGLVGRSYELVVDGAAREVRGVRCEAFCDFGAGETLMPVSEAQVDELARRLEEAGIFRLGRDYGEACCDQVHYDLVYERDGESARVRGSDQRLPPELIRVIHRIEGMAEGRVPTLVAPATRASDWPRDPYTLGAVEVDGATLSAEVSYGGGCGEHRMDLVAWGGWMESWPVQIRALITHDDGNDLCDAVVAEERVFDLTPLAEAYRAAYGPGGDQPIRVVLQLWDPRSASPTGRLVEIVL